MAMSNEAKGFLACFRQVSVQHDFNYAMKHPDKPYLPQESHYERLVPQKREVHELCNSFFIRRPYEIGGSLLYEAASALYKELHAVRMRATKNDDAFVLHLSPSRFILIQTSYVDTPVARQEVLVCVLNIDLAAKPVERQVAPPKPKRRRFGSWKRK